MNPYAFANLTNPAVQPDWRLVERGRSGAVQNYSLSRAVYRLVTFFEALVAKK